MSQKKIHFIYEENKEPNASFARGLIDVLGQNDFESATDVVTIGGDGMLLQALRLSHGKKVFGVIPPGSNSHGFWTNSNIESPEDLLNALNSQSYAITPLKAAIVFADGSSTVRYGFNEVSVRGVYKEMPADIAQQFKLSSIDVSVQSALINLKISFSNSVIGPARIMGSGLIFAKPLGSTAMNSNYGGPTIDIRNDVIVLTGIGTSDPFKGFNSVVNNRNTVFDIEVGSPEKRPVMMTFDSFGVVKNKSESAIQKLTISNANEKTVELVLTRDPGIRAYSAIMPKDFK